jgi:hypothetical protein
MREPCIPMPLQVVIDDVGWRRGRNDGANNGPYRTGVERNHGVEDYAALVTLGKARGVRPLAAFVIGEWDRHNRLRAYPSSQWMGTHWDNASIIGDWLDASAQCLIDGENHLELALHGVGHEYWRDGRMERAEWHDAAQRPRPRDEHSAHLEAFATIWKDNGLGALPTSFVPCAFLHRFG